MAPAWTQERAAAWWATRGKAILAEDAARVESGVRRAGTASPSVVLTRAAGGLVAAE